MTTEREPNEPQIFIYNCKRKTVDLAAIDPKCALCKNFLPKHLGVPQKEPVLHLRRRWFSKEEIKIGVCGEGGCGENQKGSLGVRAEGVFDQTSPTPEE